jgi:hypothetical protein
MEGRWDCRNAGERWDPLAPRPKPGLAGLRWISCAASAECEWIERPWRAGRPHASCQRSSGTALREMVAEEQTVDLYAVAVAG